jgi:long-chain acyl-CoA synthetase
MAIQTLCELFYASVDGFKKPEQLRYKKDGAWRGLSSEELRAAVEEVAAGLDALGVATGDHVAILSENRPEWAFADLAVLALGGADVPIYPSLPALQVLYLLKDSEAKAVFVSNAGQAAKIAEVRGELPGLRHVIAFDAVTGVLGLDALRARGRETLAKDAQAVRRRAAAVRASDLATIIYTSGTTGDPKGVMLSHGNLVSNALGAAQAFREIRSDWVCLSFLPLCHVFERTAGHNLMLHCGVTIAYAESVERVVENMVEVRPQMMSSVPRLYEKMYARVHEKAARDPAWRRALFGWAIAVGRAGFAARVARREPGLVLRLKLALADRLVFSRIKARTGGRLRIFVSGGAPLAREIAEFFGAADILICEGYGLTETSPVITCNRPERLRPGSVGLPLEGVELRIADDGEILTRGAHVMQGYYKKPVATREAIDAQGYFHTGDIGHVDADGFLVISDRKKDLIATSGGKKIAPQPIENRLKGERLISEVVIVGNRRNFPAALVVPNYELLAAWAAARGIVAPREELVKRPEVVAHYLELVRGMTQDLAQFEKIKKVALLPKELSQEAGELTPTFKVKRRVVEERYKELIDDLYRGAA